jgi:hypothetical protein
MALFISYFLLNQRVEIKRNDNMIVNSYLTLVKWHKMSTCLPTVKDSEQERGGRGEPELNKQLWVQHINCPEWTTLPVTDPTWHPNTVVTENGCNTVDWIHLVLDRQVHIVDVSEHGNDFNVIHISCTRHINVEYPSWCINHQCMLI